MSHGELSHGELDGVEDHPNLSDDGGGALALVWGCIQAVLSHEFQVMTEESFFGLVIMGLEPGQSNGWEVKDPRMVECWSSFVM